LPDARCRCREASANLHGLARESARWGIYPSLRQGSGEPGTWHGHPAHAFLWWLRITLVQIFSKFGMTPLPNLVWTRIGRRTCTPACIHPGVDPLPSV
jgi:hypothetical protein